MAAWSVGSLFSSMEIMHIATFHQIGTICKYHSDSVKSMQTLQRKMILSATIFIVFCKIPLTLNAKGLDLVH